MEFYNAYRKIKKSNYAKTDFNERNYKDMKRLERKAAYLLCTALLTAALSACQGDLDNDNRVSQSVQNNIQDNTDNLITNELVQSVIENEIEAPDLTNAVKITLSDNSAVITGNGAKEDGGVVTVTSGGTYIISGTASNGRIIVNAPKEKVNIVLENADITCSYGSPLYVYKSSLTTLYLKEGTKNVLTDSGSYTFNDSFSSAADEEPNACLYSKSDLIIAGSGSLTVNANYKNGITSKDTLMIESASVSVTAAANGINGKDSCTIKNASVKVESGDDAIRSTNDTDTSLGYIIIADSQLELTSGEDGIQAETSLMIDGGKLTIKSGGGNSGKVSNDVSAKGIKAGSSVALNDGTYELDCCDDAIHSNGNIVISGGSYTISTGDDGIHADANVKITAGEIDIQKSYEGIEGETIDISGGTINIVSSDDGLNAAGGADQSGFGGMRGGDRFKESSNASISISGGVITIDASGDGIDSNGSLNVSGGEIYVSGPTDSGNGALDYDKSAEITGGLIVAVGSSGMAQNFGSSSTQGSILLTYSAYSDSGITVKDSQGNVLAEYTPNKPYNCVLISAPSLTQGNTYTINACGEETSVTLDSLIYGNSAGMGGWHGAGPNMGDRENTNGRPDRDWNMDKQPNTDENTYIQPGGGMGDRPGKRP